MRVALLFVALFGMVALAAAGDATSTYTLKGTFYPVTSDCTGSTSYSVSSTSTGTATSYPCSTVGTGSGAYALNGYCYNYNVLSINWQYWYLYAYLGGTCPTSGTGIPTGYTSYLFGTGADFSTKVVMTNWGTGTNGCFQPSGCSSASTLVVPSVLLVALAYVASKLSL